jgi:hypothetical protein
MAPASDAENTEKGDMVTLKSLKFTQKNVFVDG